MMAKRVFLTLYLLSLGITAHAAEVPADAGMAEVRGLGSLNGTALACSYLDAAARIKKIIIKHAPKSRRYGEAFETATGEAFRDSVKKGQDACPDIAVITTQANEFETRLQTAVPPEMAQ